MQILSQIGNTVLELYDSLLVEAFVLDADLGLEKEEGVEIPVLIVEGVDSFLED